MRRVVAGLAAATLVTIGLAGSAGGQPPAPLKFSVSFGNSVRATPTDGRVLVVVSRDGSSEPAAQIDIIDGVPFWGKNVTGMRPGSPVVLDSGAAVYGYPLPSIKQLPAGRYYVQAFLNRYETFHRSDG